MLGFAGSALFTLLIPSMPTLAALCLTQVGNGFMQGLIFPLLLSKSVSEIDPFKRATAMGFYQAVYAIGMSAGPFVAGWMSSVYGLTGGFWLGGIAAVLATILSWGMDEGYEAEAAKRNLTDLAERVRMIGFLCKRGI